MVVFNGIYRLKDKRSVIGVGSVGLSTLFFLNKNNELPPNSRLFVKSGFEEKIRLDSINSVASKKKLAALFTLKDMNILYDFKDALQGQNNTENLVNIVGLGGDSGEFLVNLSKSHLKRDQDIKSFCTLPFHFEGTKKMNMALHQLEQLQKIPGECIVLKNQDLIKLGKKTFDEAFDTYHELIEKRIVQH